ncbi:MAG: alanine/glycine:cation symporter family protein [Haliea sp.]|uniref:alanine/glycine:cation symporter family protein n=1 Tax=Haliea sp. TaxID=1932666 RepID=UPI0032ED9BD2
MQALAASFQEITVAIISMVTDIAFSQVRVLGVDVEWAVLWMAVPMLFFTVYLGFVNVRCFPLSIRILKGRYADPDAPGEVTQFQALTTALAGTVGLGNIAGVAIAIGIGGPGAAFWMMVIAFFAMSLKFAESTLAVKHRTILADGSVFGGPMYYLRAGLEERNWPLLGKVLALSYALCAIPQMLVYTQVNQAYSQLSAVTGLEAPWTFGFVLALAVALVIIGGIRSIASVTSRVVPLMCAIYLLAAVTILVLHAGAIPGALVSIVSGAFAPEGVVGGVIGVFVIGMRRAVYSTEAGTGVSTMVHAAAKTREPVSQGLAASTEPFFDTVVVNFMTALVIVVTGAYQLEGLNDIQITSAAFGSVIWWFPYILAVCVLLFAFTTIISWSYYMSRVWAFLFGHSRLSMYVYRVLFCVALIPGGVLTVRQVIDFIDSLVVLVTIPNIIGLYILAPTIKRDLRDYLAGVAAPK